MISLADGAGAAPTARHYIGGRFTDSIDGTTFAVTNPSTGQPAGVAARGSDSDVAAAVEAAAAALETGDWAGAPASHRRSVLFRAADLIEARAADLAAIQALEMGEPIGEAAEAMVARSAWNFRFFAEEQELAANEAYNLDDRLITYTLTHPVGVFGLITPWNGPVMLSTWKIAPCIAYGNSAVHKPSELAPLSIAMLAEILDEAGIPPGVYNAVHGFGPEAGAALVEHPRIAGVSFTGSPRAARDISRRTAGTTKRVSLELGGKSATIIFEDAPLDEAVREAAAAIFSNTGQSCVAGSRILVQQSIYHEFLARFEAHAETWRVGDPFDPDTVIGPVVSAAQYERVMGYLELAAAEGTILFGGASRRDEGFFIEPTAIIDIDPDSRVCREEIFGPVAVVLPFTDAADALAIANDSSYGLAGYIWTGSQSTAHSVALRLEAGMIWINSGFARDLRQPFGGVKGSGEGREGANHSRAFYCETRFVSFPVGRIDEERT